MCNIKNFDVSRLVYYIVFSVHQNLIFMHNHKVVLSYLWCYFLIL